MKATLGRIWDKSRKTVLTLLLGFLLGTLIIMVFSNENPLKAYGALITGSLVGKLNLGSTLVAWTTLMLVALGFSVANTAGCFNTGVEGDLFMGAMAATAVGIWCKDFPTWSVYILCVLASVIAGALWALIPGLLQVKLNVNMICSCAMLNMVAQYFTQFCVQDTALRKPATQPLTYEVAVRFSRIMKPSRLNTGIFFAVIIGVFVIWMVKRSGFGMKLSVTGQNPLHARYAGVNPDGVRIKSMLISGALAGFAGCIEILGNYGYFLQDFAAGLGNKGLLAAMIVKCNVVLVPISAFFVSMISTGSVYLQQVSNVPKSLGDSLTSIFIIIATMELLFSGKRRIGNQPKKTDKGDRGLLGGFKFGKRRQAK